MDDFEITYLEGGAGLVLTGELDLQTAPRLIDAFGRVETNGSVKLDLSELTFIDSSGLYAIVQCARSTNGSGPLVLEGANEYVRHVLRITDLAEHSEIEIRDRNGV